MSLDSDSLRYPRFRDPRFDPSRDVKASKGGPVRTRASKKASRAEELWGVEETGFIQKNSLLEKAAYRLKKGTEVSAHLFVHIHCGATARDTGYEGLNTRTTVRFLQEQLEWARDSKGSLLSNREELEQLKLQVDALLESEELIAGFEGIKRVPVHTPYDRLDPLIQGYITLEQWKEMYDLYHYLPKDMVIRACAQKLEEKIRGLEAGESFSFPCGPQKHAMFLKVEKKANGKYTFYKYNAQMGAEISQGGLLFAYGKGAFTPKVRPFVMYDEVEEEDFALFKHLLKVKFYPEWYPDSPDYQYDQGDIEACFKPLSTKIVSDLHSLPEGDRLASLFIRAQRSGTCTQKSLRAWLLHQCPRRALFKEIGIEARFLSLLQFYHQNERSLEKPEQRVARTLLRAGAESLCSSVQKYYKQTGKKGAIPHISERQAKQLVATAYDVISRLDKIEESLKFKGGVDTRPVAPDSERSSLAGDIASRKGRMDLLSGASVAEGPRAVVRELSKIKTAEQLAEWLGKICVKGKTARDQGSLAVRTFASEVESFLLEALPEVSDKFWNEIPEEELLRSMGSFEELLNLYTSTFPADTLVAVHPRQQVVSTTLFALIHRLAIRKDFLRDTPLLQDKGFGVPRTFSELIEDPFFSVESPQLFAKVLGLQRYFKGKGGALFNFGHGQIFSPTSEYLKTDQNDFYLEVAKGRLGREYKGGGEALTKELKAVFKTKDPKAAQCAFLWQDLGQELVTGKEVIRGKKKVSLEVRVPSLLNELDLHDILYLKKASHRCLAVLGRVNLSSPQKIGTYSRIEVAPKSGKISNWFSGYPFLIGGFRPATHSLFSDKEQARINTIASAKALSSTKGEQQWGIHSQNEYLMRDQKGGEDSLLMADCSEPRVRSAVLLQHMTKRIEFIEQVENRRLVEQLFFRPITTYKSSYESFEGMFNPLFLDLQKGPGKNPDRTLALVKKYVDRGLALYHDAQPGGVPKVSECLFFIRFAQRVERAYFELNEEFPKTRLYKASLFEDLLKYEEVSDQNKGRIHLHRITEILYRKEADTLKPEEWVDVLESWIRVQEQDLLNKLASSQRKQVVEVQRLVLHAQPTLSRLFQPGRELKGEKSFATIVGNGLLQRLVPTEKGADFAWESTKEGTTGIKTHRSDSGEFWQFDCDSGKIWSKRGLVGQGLGTFNPDQNYRRLFGDREAKKVWREGETLCFVDSVYGNVRIVRRSRYSRATIQRKIGGEWFVFMSELPGEMHGVLASRDFTHWSPVEKSEEPIGDSRDYRYFSHYHSAEKSHNGRLYICDADTAEIIYEQDKEGNLFPYDAAKPAREAKGGRIVLPKHVLQARWDGEKGSAFNRIEDSQGILCWQNPEGEAVRIELPRIQTGSGSLSFIKEEGRWALESNPNYFVVQPQEEHLVTTARGEPLHAHYLLLQHKETGKRQLLFTDHPLMWSSEGYSSEVWGECLDLSCEKRQWGQVQLVTATVTVDTELVADSPEGNLFFALQFLLAKDYISAVRYLKKVSKAEQGKLGAHALLLLRALLTSGKAAKDFSPSASAVRLHAFCCLSKELFPLSDNPFEEIEDEDLRISTEDLRKLIQADYIAYLQGHNRLKEAIQLSDEVERGFLTRSFWLQGSGVSSRRTILKERELEFCVKPTYPTKSTSLKDLFAVTSITEFYPWFYGDQSIKVEPKLPLYKESLSLSHFIYSYQILKNPEESQENKRALFLELPFLSSSGTLNTEQFKSFLYSVWHFPEEAPKLDFLGDSVGGQYRVNSKKLKGWLYAVHHHNQCCLTPKKIEDCFSNYMSKYSFPEKVGDVEAGLPEDTSTPLSFAHFIYCYRLLKSSASDQEKRDLFRRLQASYKQNQYGHDQTAFAGDVRQLFYYLQNFIRALRFTYLHPKKAPEIDFVGEEGSVNLDKAFSWYKNFEKAVNENTRRKLPATASASREVKGIRQTITLPQLAKREKGSGLLEGEVSLSWKSQASEYDTWIKECFAAKTEPALSLQGDALPAVKINKEQLTKKEKPYFSVIQQQQAFFNRDMKYVPLEKTVYTSQDEGASRIKKQLEDSLKPDELEKLEKRIEKQLNRVPVGQVHAFAGKVSQKRKTILDSMRICLRFSPGKERGLAFRRLNPHLSIKEAADLEKQVLLYMMRKTQQQHIRRSLKVWDSCTGDDYTKFVETLQQKRSYDPLGNTYALYFECTSGLRMRPKQARLIGELSELALLGAEGRERARDVVFQLMMGGGKTSVILSALLDMTSEVGFPSVLLLHPSQFDAVQGNVRKYQKERFGKELIPIDYSREQLKDPAVLGLIYQTMSEAYKKRDMLVMKAGMPQVWELELISVSKKIQNASGERGLKSLKERQQFLALILQLYQKSIAMVDEVHLVLNLQQEINFPDSQRAGIKAERVEVVKDIYRMLNRGGGVPIKQNKQADLSQEEYFARVLPKVANDLVVSGESLLGSVPEKYRNAYQRYVRGEIGAKLERWVKEDARKEQNEQEVPSRDFKGSDGEDFAFMRYLWVELPRSSDPTEQEMAQAIALSRWLLQTVVPHALSKSTNRNYGRHSSGTGKVVPYLGVGTEAGTEFGNPYEALCFHFQTALWKEKGKGISPGQIQNLAEQMEIVAKQQARAQRKKIDQLPIAKAFETLTSVPLHEAASGKKEFLEKACAYVNADAERVLSIEAETSTLFANFYPSFLSANPFDLVGQQRGVIACSGTPGEIGAFHTRFGTEEAQKLDKGTEGRVLATMMSRLQEDPSRAHEIIDDDLSTILREFKNSEERCLIDTGGLLKRYTGFQLARGYLKHFEGNKDRQAVLFFHQYTDPKTKKRKTAFALLKKGAKKPLLLKDTTKEEIEKHGVDWKKIFYYYDEYHTTGTDIPMPPGTKAFLTLDPLYMTQSGLAQGALRPRDFFGSQDIHYLIKKDAVKSLLGGGDDAAGMICPTAIKNQAIRAAEQLKRSYRLKLHNAFRRVCMEQLVLLARTGKDTDAFTHASLAYLERSFDDTPLSQFGSLAEEMDTQKYFEGLQRKMFEDFTKALGELLPKESIESAEKQSKHVLTSLGKDIEEGKVPKTMQVEGASSLGTEVRREVQVEVAVQVEKEVELDQELQNELHRYLSLGAGNEVEEAVWTGLRDLKGGMPEKNGVGVAKMWDYLEGGGERGLPGQRYRVFYNKEYHRCFPEDLPLFVSDNFCVTGEERLPVFHPMHKKAEHILAVQEEGRMKFLLLSHSDHMAFKKYMQETSEKQLPYWVLDTAGNVVQDWGLPAPFIEGEAGRDGFRKDLRVQVERLLCYVHFFNGNIFALDGEDSYTDRLLQEGSKQLKQRFLKLRVEKDLANRKLFYRSKRLYPEGERIGGAPRFIIEARSERLLRAKVGKYEVKDIEKMPALEVPYLRVDQVQHLKTEEQIKNLPEPLIAGVLPAHVLHLTEDQLCHLKQEDQIQAVPLAQLQRLTQEQVPHFSAEQARAIPEANKEWLLHLSAERFQEMTDEQFACLHDLFVPGSRTAQEKVPLLTWDQLEQLDNSEELYQHLSKEQVKLINDEETLQALPEAAVAHVSVRQAQALLPEQLLFLSKEVFAKISSGLDEEQWRAIVAKGEEDDWEDKVALFINQLPFEKVKAREELYKYFRKELIGQLTEGEPVDGDNLDILRALPENCLAYVAKEQIRYLHEEQLPHLSREVFAEIATADLQRIMNGQQLVEKVSEKQAKNLLNLQWRAVIEYVLRGCKIDDERKKAIASLSRFVGQMMDPTLIAQLPEETAPHLTKKQLPHIPDSFVPHLKKEVFAHISSYQLHTVQDVRVLIKKASAEQRWDFSDDQWREMIRQNRLTVDFVHYVSAEAVAEIPFNLVNLVTEKQVPYLCSEQVKHLKGKKKIQAVVKPNLFTALEVSQLKDLSDAQIQLITEENAAWLDYLTREQFAKLSDEQIRWEVNGSVLLDKLPASRASALTKKQWKEIAKAASSSGETTMLGEAPPLGTRIKSKQVSLSREEAKLQSLVQAVKGTSVNEFPASFACYLLPAQVGSVVHPDLVSALSVDLVKYLPPKALRHLKADAKIIKKVPDKYLHHLDIKQLNARYYEKPSQRFTNPILGFFQTLLAPIEAVARFFFSLFMQLPRAIGRRIFAKTKEDKKALNKALGKQIAHTFFLSWIQPLLTNWIGIFHRSYYIKAKGWMNFVE